MKVKYLSNYNTHIRINKEQLKWLKENKPKKIKSVSGFLDIIINTYKRTK